MKRHAWTALAVAAAIAAAVPWALAADKTPPADKTAVPTVSTAKIKLTLAPLPPTALIFSPAENLRGSPMLSGNVFLPEKALAFKGKSGSDDLVLGGVTVTLGYVGPGNFTMKYNEKVSNIRPSAGGVGLDPVGLNLSKDHQYVLSFPSARTLGAGTTLYCRSGSVQKGTINGQTIAFYDSDTDGSFAVGKDSVCLGSGSGLVALFAPLNKFIETKGLVVEVKDLAQDGSELSYTPYMGKTSKLLVSQNVRGVEYDVALASSDAQASAVASVAGGSSVEIAALPGSYQVLYGVVISPQTRKVVATVKVPASVAVVEGQDAKVELGGPFTLEFSASVKDKKITVSGTSFSLKGKDGEIYANLQHASEPQVALIVDNKTIPLGQMTFG